MHGAIIPIFGLNFEFKEIRKSKNKPMEKLKIAVLIPLILCMFLQIGYSQDELNKSNAKKEFTIENCVNEYSIEKSDKTKSGHRFWFADKDFIDGRTIKLSAVKPGTATHPPHAHHQDEFFFVLEGKAKFYLDGKTKIVGPYTSLYCPANVPHGISNAGETELKYLVIKKIPQ